MKKFVYRNYPASNLPDDLRGDINPSSLVTVTIVEEEKRPETVMSLEEIFSLKGFRRRSGEEIDQALRRDRDEWDD